MGMIEAAHIGEALQIFGVFGDGLMVNLYAFMCVHHRVSMQFHK